MKVSSDSPVAGFLGPLLLVLRLGIRLPSETVHLICLLQVFCFLSFYVVDLFLFFFFLPRSSSSPSVAAFCSFSFSRWSLVLGLALGLVLVLIRLFYDDNRMGGVFLFFTYN